MDRQHKHFDLPNRLAEVHQAGVDWKSRTVYIVGELTEEKGYRYVPVLRMLDETPGSIKVCIMSDGGLETEGFAIFDTMNTMKNKVVTIGCGAVYSIAALIFQGGGERLLMPNADLMMHNGTLQLPPGDNNTDFIEQVAEEAKRNNGRYHRAIASRTGRSLQIVEGWCKEERYFLPQEAVDCKLADRIVKSWKDVK